VTEFVASAASALFLERDQVERGMNATFS
jgi:hypothetical protein